MGLRGLSGVSGWRKNGWMVNHLISDMTRFIHLHVSQLNESDIYSVWICCDAETDARVVDYGVTEFEAFFLWCSGQTE